MTYEYLSRIVVDAELNVDDPGNCAILARNDSGEEFYLIVNTLLGETEILQYGPCIPDISALPRTVNYTYTRFPFSDKRINATINKFLNDPKACITQADVTTAAEIRELIKNPIDCLQIDL